MKGTAYLDLVMQADTLNKFLEKEIVSALDMPAYAGAFSWEALNSEQRNNFLGKMLRDLVIRAKEIPYFASNPLWENIDPEQISTFEDIHNLPPMVKDTIDGTNPGLVGYRNALLQNPEILVSPRIQEFIERQERANPEHKEILEWYKKRDLTWWPKNRKLLAFGSGGTQGKSTITLLSYLTVEMEAWALARALRLNGFKEGQVVACLYNTSHKGGVVLERAANLMNMPFYSQTKIFNWIKSQGRKYRQAVESFENSKISQTKPTDEEVEFMRDGIGKFMITHKVEIIEAVQPPRDIKSGEKGIGLEYMSIHEKNKGGILKYLNQAFLTGIAVPNFAQEALRNDNINVTTTYGKGEAMAGATSGVRTDDVNIQMRLFFPTYELVAEIAQKGDFKLKKTPKGQRGIVFTTSLIGGGSTFINNAMDAATENQEPDGLQDIDRLYTGEAKTAVNSCASGVVEGR